MRSIIFFIILGLQINTNGYSQDTARIRISLLTCTPGDDLYSIFGHSALRIYDSTTNSDIVYNYGTFNFEDPNFYVKFARGKLLYFVSTEYFRDFEYYYQYTNRLITEQVLALDVDEKSLIQQALLENLKEENRYYHYDFFFDNCTTRLRDLILRFKKNKPVLPPVMPQQTTFRNAIHQYLDNGKQYWSKLGIDILLGAKTDRVMTAEEQQFLPDNLMNALDRSTPVTVQNKSALYSLSTENSENSSLTPLFVCAFFVFGYLVLYIVFKNKKPALVNGMDGMLFFLTGLLGWILIFMWFGTDHIMTKNNYNLLWALPTHLPFAFLISNRQKWVKTYFAVVTFIMLLLILVWFFLPQQMNPALLPLVGLLTFRSAEKWKKW